MNDLYSNVELYFTGASTNGGSHIAVYHSKDDMYSGAFMVHVGYRAPQYCSVGTVYLATFNGTKTITDNRGYTSSHRINKVEKLTLDGVDTSAPAMSFATYSE